MQNKTIRNLDSLEQEIGSLQTECKKLEKELTSNIDWFQENATRIIFNEFIRGKTSSASKTEGTIHFFKNETINRIVTTVADRIASRAANGIDNLLSKVFRG